MTDVFISYSRKDRAFVQVLNQALVDSKYNAWVDWESIPLTADWWEEIKAGIEGADTFIFVITPDSIASKVCRQEVDHAVENNKRLVPVVRRDGFDMAQVHPELGKTNWLFFQEENDFDTAFQSLVDTLNTDLTHVKTHTRLLVRTLEWDKKHRSDDFLLRGSDLDEAESWLERAIAEQHEPLPTEQQKTYITKSREVENARQRLTAAGEKAKRLVRIGSAVLGSTLVAAALVSVFTWRAFQELNRAKVATRLERESNLALQQLENAPLEALLMAVRNAKELQALDAKANSPEDYPTTTPLVVLRTIVDNIKEQNQIQAYTGAVTDVRFSPDGTLIATTGSPDEVVRLWQLSGELAAELEGHEGSVERVVFNRNGTLLATAGTDSTVRLWSVEGEAIATLRGHDGPVTDVKLPAQGDRVISSGEDGTVCLWTLEGELLSQFLAADEIAQEQSGLGIRFNWDDTTQSIHISSVFPNSPAQQAGLQAGDRIIKIDGHPLENATPIQGNVGKSSTLTLARAGQPNFSRTIQRQTYTFDVPVSINSLDWDAQAQQIITGDAAGYLRTWSLTGQKLFENKAHRYIHHVEVSPDNQMVISVGRYDPAKLWTRDGEMVSELPLGTQHFFRRAAFSPDGQTIATVGEEGTTQLWTLGGEEIHSLKGHTSLLFGVDFSLDGQQIVTGGLNGTVRLWNLQGASTRQFQAHQTRLHQVAATPDGQGLITSGLGDNERPILWSLDGEKQLEFPLPSSATRLRLSPDGQHLMTTGGNGIAHLWNLEGEEIARMIGHRGFVIGAAFSPDGRTVATTGEDGTARLWNLEGEEMLSFVAARARVYSIDFSPDGQVLATAGQDGIPRLWTREGENIVELQGHKGGVNEIRFSPDGEKLVTAGQDGTVRLWTVTGDALAVMRGHQGEVWEIGFSPDGQNILSAGEGGTTRLWTLSGTPITEFRIGQQRIPRVAFSSDGQHIFIGDGEGFIKMLPAVELSANDLLDQGCAWLQDYLDHNSSVQESDRALCDS